MPLNDEEREYVVASAVDILRHRRRDKLLEILERRLVDGDYLDVDERDLDRVVLALVKAIDAELGSEDEE